MYFESRSQAGAILADQVLEKYRYENCAVVAIGEGGVLIGEQIAVKLHCVLMMLLSEGIEIPGESLSIGGDVAVWAILRIIANFLTVKLMNILVNFTVIWKRKSARLIRK